MPKKILSILVSFTIIPIAVFSVQRFSQSPIGNTGIWWLIQIIIVLIFIGAAFVYFKTENRRHFLFVNLYLLWVVISIIRGIFVAELYWDYKSLITYSFALLLVIIAYTATDNEILQSLLSYFIKFALPLAAIILLPMTLGVWGWYLFPVTFVMIFLPVIKTNWRIILLMLSLIAMFGNITVRSHLIRYGFPFLLLLVYYFRFFIESNQIMNISRKVLMVAPWLLFILAVVGIFNVFNMKEYLKVNVSGDIEGGLDDPTVDSRTFLYEEVIESAIKYNYWLIGRTPARGNETVWFASFGEELTGRNERYWNEANMTNIFTWMGIVGVILHFLVFYKASFLALYRSNNIYVKFLGVFVAFRWAYAWVEDAYWFDTNNFTIWLMVGTCLSESFRKMNNLEVKLWARGIFDARYVKLRMFIKKEVPVIIH